MLAGVTRLKTRLIPPRARNLLTQFFENDVRQWCQHRRRAVERRPQYKRLSEDLDQGVQDVRPKVWLDGGAI